MATSERLVIGHGEAGRWADNLSAVLPADADLIALARRRGLYDVAQRAGYATRNGEILDDGWLIVGNVRDESDLDSDPSVLAYCEVQS